MEDWQVGSDLPSAANTMWWSINRWIGTGFPSGPTTFTLIAVMKPSTCGDGTTLTCCLTS